MKCKQNLPISSKLDLLELSKFITYCNWITGFEASAVLLVQLFLLDNNIIWITAQPSRELQSLTTGK